MGIQANDLGHTIAQSDGLVATPKPNDVGCELRAGSSGSRLGSPDKNLGGDDKDHQKDHGEDLREHRSTVANGRNRH